MRTHRGSIRDLLISVSYIRQPGCLRPHNRRWRFRRELHAEQTKRYAESLVGAGTAILAWLANPVEVLREVAERIAEPAGLEVDHDAFDRAAGYADEPVQHPTEDAYMRACRALHWRTAQLRSLGVEPDAIPLDAPHEPPEGHVFENRRT